MEILKFLKDKSFYCSPDSSRYRMGSINTTTHSFAKIEHDYVSLLRIDPTGSLLSKEFVHDVNNPGHQLEVSKDKELTFKLWGTYINGAGLFTAYDRLKEIIIAYHRSNELYSESYHTHTCKIPIKSFIHNGFFSLNTYLYMIQPKTEIMYQCGKCMLSISKEIPTYVYYNGNYSGVTEQKNFDATSMPIMYLAIDRTRILEFIFSYLLDKEVDPSMFKFFVWDQILNKSNPSWRTVKIFFNKEVLPFLKKSKIEIESFSDPLRHAYQVPPNPKKLTLKLNEALGAYVEEAKKNLHTVEAW